MLKKILLLALFTTIFSVLIFFGTLIIKKNDKEIINEENLLLENKNKVVETINKENRVAEKNIELLSAQKVQFYYFPENFSDKTKKLKNIFVDIIDSDIFKDKISNIKIEFYELKPSVRGNMKNKTLKLFGVLNIPKTELISVTIHELAHYIDLYYFEVHNKNDISSKFYSISWKSYKTIKKGETIKDFVSGYAMSNKYEDFAESFTYYVLHNDDFLVKAKKSSNLEKKYNFFNEYLFKDESFIGEDYSEEEIKPYYWDITKINISLEKFLQYLKK